MAIETHTEDWSPSANAEVKQAFEEFQSTFADFRQANDARLDEIERRLTSDVVTEEKVDRINAALDEQKAALDRLSLSRARPGFADPAERETRADSEHRAAFANYIRKGDTHGLRRYEAKALSAGSDPDGGYVVPKETEAVISRALTEISPIRSIASVRQIGATAYRKPISDGGMASGWVAETDARTQTNTAQISLVEFPAMEIYAMPAATQTLLDDSLVDIEQWVASEVNVEFAEEESKAFISGNGTSQPKGFLSYTKTAEASHAWGEIGYIASGADGDFAAADPGDALLDLVYAPRQSYRANGRWVMNRKTQAAIRKFKDGADNYLWQPGLAPGQPASLLGYPVTEAEDMPDIASNAYAIAFGDFTRGYLVVDRLGTRILRDPYSAKPYVLFYTTRRVGGGVQDFDAIKLMKFAAS